MGSTDGQELPYGSVYVLCIASLTVLGKCWVLRAGSLVFRGWFRGYWEAKSENHSRGGLLNYRPMGGGSTWGNSLTSIGSALDLLALVTKLISPPRIAIVLAKQEQTVGIQEDLALMRWKIVMCSFTYFANVFCRRQNVPNLAFHCVA